MRRELWVALGLLALVFVLAWSTRKEPQPTPGVTHGSADVAQGGYAAWYELLEREGLHPRRFDAPHEDLAADGVGTLVLAFPGAGVDADWDAVERDALHAWVHGGGRLVDIGPEPALRGARDEHADVVLAPAATRPGALRGPWAALVGSLTARGDARIRVRPHTRLHVITLLADAAGALVVRYRDGRGEVVAVASGAPFENRNLARAGDARLAYLLAALPGGGGLAFDEAVRGDVVDRPWYRALDVRERVALAFLVLAGLAWLAYGLLPLGPPVRLIAAREPTSSEFLDAFAALYARARLRDHAADALLADAERRLQRAPRTPVIRQLAADVHAARDVAVRQDRQLVALAVLSRSVREETTGGGDPAGRSGPSARRPDSRRRRR
ncbi:MAG TPA: DUF4350 domain-containing protein [Candidatus Sulfotelmatobacter sp.]|nr:DUF4350 domain-containing protein [Candidatus Sulfotelmatobacter sp.]